jgi:hypothetical protein
MTGSGRVEVLREGGRLRVLLRGLRSLPGAAFLLLWLCGWGFGELTVFERLFLSEEPEPALGFLGLWLLLWTLAGGMAFRALLQTLGGTEELSVEGGELRFVRRPLGRARRIPLSQVRGLEVVRPARRGGYRLALLSAGKELRFGQRLDDAEVARVLSALEGRVPTLPPVDEPPPAEVVDPPGSGGG